MMKHPPRRLCPLESGLRYNGYIIYHDGYQFVAEAEDNESPIFEMGGPSVDRIIAKIDDICAALDRGEIPEWLETWMATQTDGRMQIAIDEVNEKPPRKEFVSLVEAVYDDGTIKISGEKRTISLKVHRNISICALVETMHMLNEPKVLSGSNFGFLVDSIKNG